MRLVVVHQVLGGAGPVDAVTIQALTYRRRFSEWGWGGEDVSATMEPSMAGWLRLLEDWRPEPGSVLVMHYSAHAPALRPLLDVPGVGTLIVFHNITPARWLWDHQPDIAVLCELGRMALPDFVGAADLTAGVSEYNAAELRAAGAREAVVIPIVFERPGATASGSSREAVGPGGAPEILFVGRLTPHKRQDAVIRAFALYRAQHAPDARLRLVGTEAGPGYAATLQELGDSLAPDAVTIESDLSDAELWERYRRASVFLCLSEHEGFCIPLLEAFSFGVAVVARPSGGVAEVAGDAALLVDDRDPAVIAELLALASSDGDLRAELARRGRARLDRYSAAAASAALRSAVERVAPGPPVW